jgi:hypothetical protein
VDTSFGLDGALDGALDLRWFEPRLEQACGGTFEQSLEESLDSGEGAGHQVIESSSAYLKPDRLVKRTSRDDLLRICRGTGSSLPQNADWRHTAGMAVLLDVYCERCGTRQATENAEPKTLAKGVRRLLSVIGQPTDDLPVRRETKALVLCLSCREYTCPNCWNDDAGVCQTCEPLPEIETAPEQQAVVVSEAVAVDAAPAPPPIVSLPELHVVVEPAPESAVALPEPYVPPEPEPMVAVPEPEPMVAEPEPEPEPFVAEPEPSVAAPEPAVAVPEPAPKPPVTAPWPPVQPWPTTQLPRPTPLQMPRLPQPPPIDRPARPSISFDSPPPPAFMANRQTPAYPTIGTPLQAAPPAQAAPTVKACRNCQLELSARARFCRRCGTAQE